MIKRLAGPGTHVCWTPDHTPESERKVVCLVEESELLALEREVIQLLAFKRSVDEALNSGDGTYRP